MRLRVKNFEFRHGESEDPNRFPEIVQYREENFFTILYWLKDGSDWSVRFCGSRSLEYLDDPNFIALIRYGQEVMSAWSKLMYVIDKD